MFLKNTRTAKDMGYVAIFTLKQVGNSSNNMVFRIFISQPRYHLPFTSDF